MSDSEQVVLQTAAFDARFPQTNQTKHCWQNFVDYQKCITAKGEEFEPCQKFKHTYQSLCPNDWVDTWNEQVEAGKFPGDITP